MEGYPRWHDNKKAVTSVEMDSPREKEMLKVWAANARKLLELASEENPSPSRQLRKE